MAWGLISRQLREKIQGTLHKTNRKLAYNIVPLQNLMFILRRCQYMAYPKLYKIPVRTYLQHGSMTHDTRFCGCTTPWTNLQPSCRMSFITEKFAQLSWPGFSIDIFFRTAQLGWNICCKVCQRIDVNGGYFTVPFNPRLRRNFRTLRTGDQPPHD